jgi:hypothetical protein
MSRPSRVGWNLADHVTGRNETEQERLDTPSGDMETGRHAAATVAKGQGVHSTYVQYIGTGTWKDTRCHVCRQVLTGQGGLDGRHGRDSSARWLGAS